MAFNYSGMPLGTYEAIDKAITQRPTSTAILGIDSEDRYSNYQAARDAQFPQQNWSAWNFTITKGQNIMNGYFTRLALTETMIQWGVPNINRKTDSIRVTWNNTIDPPYTQTLTINRGFYTPSMLAAAIQTAIRAFPTPAGYSSPGLGGFVMTYGVRTYAGGSPLQTNQPIFEYVTGSSTSIMFEPMPIDNVTYKPTTKQLFDLLGFDTGNTIPTASLTFGHQTFCLFTKYIDIVSTQLTANAALKDTSSAPTPRDLVARIYLTDPSAQATTMPSASTFCPVGCAPFTLYRDFNSPKQIQWLPNAPVGGYLQFDVYDDSGDSMSEVDDTLFGAGNSLNWSMSLLVSEN